MDVIELLPKEKLSEINFVREDVLQDPVKIRLRTIYLKKAEALGNTYKGKVKMIFKTNAGSVFGVETTIWSADENHITIKGGISIPTRSIIEIEF